MDLIDDNAYELKMGSFKDPNLENDYMNTQVSLLKRLIRFGLLIFGIFFLVFLIPDYLFNQSLDIKIKMTVLRLTIFAMILIAFFILSTLNNWKCIFLVITICELLVSIAYLYISSQYENPNFMLQLLSHILLQLVFYIIPNRLLNCMIISFLTWVIFILNSFFTFSYIPDNEFLSGIIFPLLFMIAFSYWHIRFQVEKHMQYLKNQQLLHLLNHDALTNIYNRYKFEAVLNHFLSIEDPHPLTLTLFDIDFFKKINDQHGHLFGDLVLVYLTNLIQPHLGPDDLFARWGGEEFVILHYNLSLEETVSKIQSIKASLEVNPIADHGCITCSYGITVIRTNDTLDELVHRADQLMYQAKANGRNQIIF